MSDQNVLTPGLQIRPEADSAKAKELVEKLYGFKVKRVEELNAYDDRNFHILCENELSNPQATETVRNGFVLKIMNSLDSRKTSVVEAQNEIMIFLNENDINCPFPVRNSNGLCYSLESVNGSAEKYIVRLLVYRPGSSLHQVAVSDELLSEVGQFAAKLDQTLDKFSHPAYDDHRTMWMLNSVPKLCDFTYVIESVHRRNLVDEVIDRFEKEIMGNLDKLDTGIIHGDLNEQNIVVNEAGTKIAAVLDFGDTQKSCLIFELAIALCYMMLQVKDIGRGKHVLAGYERIRKITNFEKAILKVCVCARLCQSLVLGAYSHSNDPKNEYLLFTQKSGWALLEELWPMSERDVFKIWELEIEKGD